MILITPRPNIPAAKLPDISDAVQQAQLLVRQVDQLYSDVLSVSTEPDPAILAIQRAVSSMKQQAGSLLASLNTLQRCRNENTVIF